MQVGGFCFKKTTLTPEWLVAWEGKERIQETHQEATAALRVRSDRQVAGGARGRQSEADGLEDLEVEWISLLTDWK